MIKDTFTNALEEDVEVLVKQKFVDHLASMWIRAGQCLALMEAHVSTKVAVLEFIGVNSDLKTPTNFYTTLIHKGLVMVTTTHEPSTGK